MSVQLSCGCRLEGSILRLCEKHGKAVSQTQAQATYENDEFRNRLRENQNDL